MSVLGVGGMGKTRLVVRFGWTWLGEFPGGAWFCDLSEARGIDGIVSAVARGMDVPLGTDDPVVQLGHAIAGRGRCLVVLDNFEQVARHAEETLGHWLDRAHEAHFLVTSREVLGLPGEEALVLAPMSQVAGSELLVARAQSALRGFEPRDPDAIAKLVAMLDGLPLAIELAAARVRLMPPAEMLERMSQRFRLLTSSRGRPSRQATLRATLDWSWELLSPDEQAALSQLSVFEGGFTLDAAEAVLALVELWPMDAVQGLVDKSLVRQVSEGRFALLVSVQEYADEKLGAERAACERRHWEHYAELGADDAVVALDAHGGAERRRSLSMELENLVAACRRATAAGVGSEAARTLLAARAVLELRGPLSVAAELAGDVLRLSMPEPLRATVELRTSHVLRNLGRLDAAWAHGETALELARRTGDGRRQATASGNLGALRLMQGRLGEARELMEQALSWGEGDPVLVGPMLDTVGILDVLEGHPGEALAQFEAALVACRASGNLRVEANTLTNMGLVQDRVGRTEDARASYQAALAAHRDVGSRAGQARTLCNLGHWCRSADRPDEAQEHYDAALQLARQVGERPIEANALSGLASLHRDQGRLGMALSLYASALVLNREVGNRRMEGSVLGNLGAVRFESGSMDDARNSFDQAEALLRQVGDGWILVEVLSRRVPFEVADGRPSHARALLDEAEALAARIPIHPDSDTGRLLATARAAIEGSTPTP